MTELVLGCNIRYSVHYPAHMDPAAVGRMTSALAFYSQCFSRPLSYALKEAGYETCAEQFGVLPPVRIRLLHIPQDCSEEVELAETMIRFIAGVSLWGGGHFDDTMRLSDFFHTELFGDKMWDNQKVNGVEKFKLM